MIEDRARRLVSVKSNPTLINFHSRNLSLLSFFLSFLRQLPAMASKKGSGNENPKLYKNFDPTNVTVRKSPAIGVDVVRKDNNQPISVISPPMLLVNPALTGEGNLGHEFPSNDGKTVNVNERPQAVFKLGLGVGDLGAEDLQALPLKKHQKEFMQKLYIMAENIFGAVFDTRQADFAEKIAAAEKLTIENEVDILKAQGKEGIKSPLDVTRLMETDEELRQRVQEKARARFVRSVKYMFPDPSEFDEDGNKRLEDGRNRRIALYMKRKVWSRLPLHKKKKAAEMPDKPTNKTLKSEPGNWGDIFANMQTHYKYNPFAFKSVGSKGTFTHETVEVKTVDGEKLTILDPAWTKIPSNAQTLVVMELKFEPYVAKGDMGIRVVPWGSINIFRQAEGQADDLPEDDFTKLATGAMDLTKDKEGNEEEEGEKSEIKKRKRDGQEDECEGKGDEKRTKEDEEGEGEKDGEQESDRDEENE